MDLLTKEQVNKLLNPFISKEELIKSWFDYLDTIGKPKTYKELESLAQRISTEYKVCSSAIMCLFKRRYIENTEEPCLSIKIKFTPINLDHFDSVDSTDEEFVSAIKAILQYPKHDSSIDLSTYGPCISEVNENTSIWCHESENCSHHAMLRCQCHIVIPEKGFICEGCKEFFNWKSIGTEYYEDFIRFPLEDSGWGDFYCSKDCMLDHCKKELTFLEETVIELIDSCIDK